MHRLFRLTVFTFAALIVSASPTAHGAATPRRLMLGRSEQGRPIDAIRVGDPHGTRVLVFGCIHGTECAGIAIARALEHVRTKRKLDLWIVPNLNPDGYARGSRQNGRGVDLNANWSSQWHGGGRPWDVYYPGPRPFSERETRIARSLILRIRPVVTIWYHQHMNLVWAWGPSSSAGRIYAHAAGMRFYHHHWLNGTATNWQNHHLPSSAAFTVELPAGSLTPQQVRRHVHAVLAVAAAACGRTLASSGRPKTAARQSSGKAGPGTLGRPASGQTSIEAKATLLSGHARRSRVGGGDTTLDGQRQATFGKSSQPPPPESAPLTGRHHDAENDIEFRMTPDLRSVSACA
jgi:protein MpaA